MRILITGGAGFIGSNFVKYMLRNYPNYEIINLDKLTYAGNMDNLSDVKDNKNHIFIKGDITNKALLEPLFREGLDVIVNFAAESHVDRSIIEPKVFVKTNILGTHTLLDLACKYGVSKFIQISTDEVYGSLGKDGLFSETTPLAPNSPYSSSKASADLLVRAYYKTYGLPINITRCSNNYGPYQFPEKLIPLMIINALENKDLSIYGDGSNVRDWLHVEDHCYALDLILHHGKIGEIYNIGGNNERTNLQVVKSILNILGKPESLITFVEDRLGHDKRYAIDSSKIRKELDWKPRISFDIGLQQTVDWYISNENWWKRVISGEYRSR